LVQIIFSVCGSFVYIFYSLFTFTPSIWNYSLTERVKEFTIIVFELKIYQALTFFIFWFKVKIRGWITWHKSGFKSERFIFRVSIGGPKKEETERYFLSNTKI
jgi:hypothetical protein